MIIVRKKDLIYSLIVGFITSWFLIFVIKNPCIEEFRGLLILERAVWFLPVVLPIVFLVGILLAGALARIVRVIFQVVKFAEVGVSNMAIDFGILNLLIWLTGVTGGWSIAPLNAASFLVATTNSYFWNKFWTFKKAGTAGGKKFTQFLIISTIGIGINTGIVVAGTSLMAPFLQMSPGAWVNVMKILATFASMTWNFLGYKFIVFKHEQPSTL